MTGSSFDLVVVGAGAGGLATANRAASLGARVLVLEKGADVGGSAALSAGILWTAPDLATLWRVQPDADPVLGPLVVEGYERAVADVRAAGAEVSEPWADHLEWGLACKIDIPALFAAWSAEVRASGSLLTQVSEVELVRERGRVAGVEYTHEGRRERASAPATVLATGGFQGDPELRQAFIGHGADDIAVRSNPCSVGDGFRLGKAAGGAASRHLSAFYGHLLPSPMAVTRERLLRLTLYFSAYGVLVNRDGRRFTDESLGDEVSNQFVVRQPGRRAVLIWDERVQRERALAVPYPSGMALDRHAEATALGARAARCADLGELVDAVAGWGVDGTALAATLDGYRRFAAGEAVALDAPASSPCRLGDGGPYYALEVQPCITIPFGGLRVDGDARVLDRDGVSVPGLYAVGADAGGAQDLRYIGGLVFGFVFGRRAAEAALCRA
ncbi:FAD-binding protein [Pseudonocardia acaciae]|uniref:FAD-binding protein n=1 Tax=Pseudonocardia acaciae TaxID=551276 RepID=UPI000490ADF5|nr:FAD-binding protein [Pseudonocardia acaciae]